MTNDYEWDDLEDPPRTPEQKAVDAQGMDLLDRLEKAKAELAAQKAETAGRKAGNDQALSDAQTAVDDAEEAVTAFERDVLGHVPDHPED